MFYRSSFSVAFVALLAVGVMSGVAFAQQPPTVQDLARRLEATEQRLRSTEEELQSLRERDVQRQQWEASVVRRLPSVMPVSEMTEFAGPGNYDFVDDYDDARCKTCGKDTWKGVPHVCGCSFGGNGEWCVTPFGKLELETVFASDTAVSENYIVFAATRGLAKTERIDVTGQSSQVGLNIGGPTLGGFQVGGLVLIDFHGNRPSRNEPGAYFIRAYAELVNDYWRIAFGQMGDTIGGWNAETVNWPGIGGLGFLGANQRGTFRVDRYVYPSDTVQWTLTGALTQPVVTDLAGLNDAVGQDNGLPNLEGQIVLGLGPDCGEERPLQLSLSGMYGEFFAAAFNLPPNFPAGVSNTSRAYAIAGAMQWTGERMGVRGQVWHGQGLGTYMGGISQSLNTETGDAIRATGGFAQVWFDLTSRIKVSMLAGIDDPLDRDLSVANNQRSRNRLIGGNAFFNITEYFHIGVDVWHVETDYMAAGNDNDIVVVMTEASIAY